MTCQYILQNSGWLVIRVRAEIGYTSLIFTLVQNKIAPLFFISVGRRIFPINRPGPFVFSDVYLDHVTNYFVLFFVTFPKDFSSFHPKQEIMVSFIELKLKFGLTISLVWFLFKHIPDLWLILESPRYLTYSPSKHLFIVRCCLIIGY